MQSNHLHEHSCHFSDLRQAPQPTGFAVTIAFFIPFALVRAAAAVDALQCRCGHEARHQILECGIRVQIVAPLRLLNASTLGYGVYLIIMRHGSSNYSRSRSISSIYRLSLM